MIQAQPVSDLEREGWLDPQGSGWRQAAAQRIALIGTPVGLQPTDAIRVSWTGKKIGAVSAVALRVANDGRRLAFHLEWEDASENREMLDNTDFADAAAVLLPSAPDAPLPTMGAPGKPVNAWYWRADEPAGQGRQVVAEGLGTTRPAGGEPVQAQGVWKGGRWRVVIARALRVQASEPVAQLSAGATTRFGVAVWEGGHRERAGIKAFSGDWIELRLAAAQAGR